jgi:hypothetical protein
MKIYSIEWDCQDYFLIHLVCIAENKDEAIIKFKKRFDEFNKKYELIHEDYLKNNPFERLEFFNENEITEHELNDVVLFSYEE